MEQIQLGQITKPQGIKGQVRVNCAFSILELKNVNKIFIDGAPHKVKSIKGGADFVVLEIDGIRDRNTAELFRGKKIFALKEELNLEQNSFLVSDLIGVTLFSNDTVIGVIEDITSLKTDVFTVKCQDGKIMRFPFLKRLNGKLDKENNAFVVDEKVLGEISCYED